MAVHALSANFDHFFRRINPSQSFVKQAASEHQTITGLIEDVDGLASELSPQCFLQGSYRQQTAIQTINDVDIVVLCELWQPGSGGIGGRSWGRDEIFDTIAAPLLIDRRYRDKVRYHRDSMCIKVDLSIKIEILPVVYKSGNDDATKEPFRLYRPEKQIWEDGYARYHQEWLSIKNKSTAGNFIPAIKVLKHIRSLIGQDAVSFHIECLLFRLPDNVFFGSPTDFITKILTFIASASADTWYEMTIKTPCGERDIFTPTEWGYARWANFHNSAVIWSNIARQANRETDRYKAIEYWQLLLGNDFFPQEVSQ